MGALAAGDVEAAEGAARQATRESSLFPAVASPLAARAALWAGDAERVRAAFQELESAGTGGTAMDCDRLVIRAGIAALEGNAGEALALYRETVGRWRDAGLAWDEALCEIDMATLLDPAEPEVRAAADAAREILVRLHATPCQDWLDRALRRSHAAEAARALERARAGDATGV